MIGYPRIEYWKTGLNTKNLQRLNRVKRPKKPCRVKHEKRAQAK
jgi:hypothetical protein